jgi:hypothetical protein
MATILFGAEQPLKCSVLISKHCDGDAAIARDVFENIVYCLYPGHDGHFHASIGATRKLNSRLEFLPGPLKAKRRMPPSSVILISNAFMSAILWHRSLRLPIAQQLHLSILYCVWRNAVPRG